MKKAGRFAGFELVHLLFLVGAAELAVNRLATTELRPANGTPPWWHQLIDHLGLFFQYFASTLAIGIIGYRLWRLVKTRAPYWLGARYGLVIAGVPFLLLGLVALITAIDAHASFGFETAFMLMAACILAGQLVRGGDTGVKIGLLLLITPLAVHYYGLISIRYLAGEEALWTDLPERIQQYGQWTLMVAALLSPYCFAPRPVIQALVRPGPLVIASLASMACIVLLRQHYEIAMRLSQNWLGLDIGPGVPMTSLFAYAFAVGTMTWTLTACVTAASVARRDIGVAIGLIVVSGYGFVWPVQYLVTMVGLMGIGEAVSHVAAEERVLAAGRRPFAAPPIADAVWQRYVRGLAAALGRTRPTSDSAHADTAETGAAQPTDKTDAEATAPADKTDAEATAPADKTDADAEATAPADKADADAEATEPADTANTEPASAVTVYADDPAHAITHIVTARHGVDVVVRIERYDSSVLSVEVTCGSVPKAHVEPAWTLFAQPERLLEVGDHPKPPATSAPVRALDDPTLGRRFRVCDADDHTSALLDEVLGASAAALIDGWVAFWPGHGLRYRVHPGRGAPLDHPIPISDLAFRGDSASANRLVSVIDLLAHMAARAANAAAPAE